MHRLSALILAGLYGWSEAFSGSLSPTKPAVRRASTTRRYLSSPSSSPLDLAELQDKVLVQRIRHSLSPRSDVAAHDALIIEERIRFILDPDTASEAGTLLPYKRRTLHLLDGTTRQEFYRTQVHERTSTHRGVSTALLSTYALILYLVANPKLTKGRVLELECQLGLGALLASIALAHVSGQPQGDDTKEDFDVLLPSSNNKGKVALPPAVDSLILTDADERDLNVAFQNVKTSGVASSKVYLDELDWRHRHRSVALRSGTMDTRSDDPAKKFVQTMVGADLDYAYPTAKQLARTVAQLLLPSGGTFIHVCPDDRPDLPYFRKLLREGYLMQVNSGYVKLQSHAYHYQVLGKDQDERALDDMELKEQTVKETTLEALTAFHHVDYDGFNGEFMWPIETGQYDAKGQDRYLESDGGSSPW